MLQTLKILESFALAFFVSLILHGCEDASDEISAKVGAESPSSSTTAPMTTVTTATPGPTPPNTPAPSPQVQLTSWNAEPWGECISHQNASTGLSHREVQCKTLFGNQVLDDSLCNPVHKPCACMPCECGIVNCVNNTNDANTLNATCESLQCIGEEMLPPELEPIGCLTLSAYKSNVPEIQQNDSDANNTHDYSCMTCQGTTPCRGGLPFFKSRIHTTNIACASFCVNMGLDLSGICPQGFCHCGAAPLNAAVYHLEQPRACLLMDISGLVAADSASCSILVHRFVGAYVEHAIPSEWVTSLEQDDLYRDSIENGTLIRQEYLDMGPPDAHQSDAQPALLNNAASWSRSCWPSQCGPVSTFRMFQDTQTNRPAGATQNWNKYIMIPYAFQSGLNNDRKNAFRAAADTWRRQSCINLYEVGNGFFDPYQLWVKSDGSNTGCWAYLGKQLSGYSTINLGWCNSNLHLGSIVHEIGHSLGMNHEQKRPDATRSYYGAGPHLRLLWQNIEYDWKPQYLPDSTSYTGSAYDGAGDVQTGYAPYDFGSIMHYPIGYPHSTIPAGRTTGNRRTLSAGDIRQISDMYGCHVTSGNPNPGPAPSPSGNYYRRENGIGGWGGICTCPDGRKYEVGDNGDWCGSLACENGQAGVCSIFGISGNSKGMKVTCAGSGPAPSPTCVDKHNSCRDWVNAGYCQGQYAASLQVYCPRSCGFCTGGRLLNV